MGTETDEQERKRLDKERSRDYCIFCDKGIQQDGHNYGCRRNFSRTGPIKLFLLSCWNPDGFEDQCIVASKNKSDALIIATHSGIGFGWRYVPGKVKYKFLGFARRNLKVGVLCS